MSSSSYCQGFQSCLEPSCLVEPRVLRLKLAPSKLHTSSSSTTCNPLVDDSFSDNNVDMGGWSFLQSLAKNTSQSAEESNNNVYIPPNFKSSSSMLSAKSLEMCTESLGSETGSDASDSSDEMALLSLDTTYNYETRVRSKLHEKTKMCRSASFPPPLTSISGSTSVRVRPHREDGRLVLQAVTVSCWQSYFHTERSTGRLKLHLMNNNQEQHEAEGEEEVGEEGIQSEDDEDWQGEDLEGNIGNVEGEMVPMPRRCKEDGSGNKSGLLSWEPFLVAT